MNTETIINTVIAGELDEMEKKKRYAFFTAWNQEAAHGDSLLPTVISM